MDLILKENDGPGSIWIDDMDLILRENDVYFRR
jgi:hypothetical protein